MTRTIRHPVGAAKPTYECEWRRAPERLATARAKVAGGLDQAVADCSKDCLGGGVLQLVLE